MLKISCPWCFERSEEEFIFGGPAHVARPNNNDEISDKQWAEYLFMRDNVKGVSLERHGHVHGCGQWFNMARNTLTHEIHFTYKMGEQPPKNWQSICGGDDE